MFKHSCIAQESRGYLGSFCAPNCKERKCRWRRNGQSGFINQEDGLNAEIHISAKGSW